MIYINSDQEAQLAALEVSTATPEEEAVKAALLELDERDEELTAAEAVVAVPAPDPVALAREALGVAQSAYQVAEDARVAAVAAKAASDSATTVAANAVPVVEPTPIVEPTPVV